MISGSFAINDLQYKASYGSSTPCKTPPNYWLIHLHGVTKIKIIILRILSLLQGSFAKETYILKEPTNRSHPIGNLRIIVTACICMSPSRIGAFKYINS